MQDQWKSDDCVAMKTQYGMREKTLANRIGVPQFRGMQLLRAHQEA
ncbi:MAG: hypothetical protein ACWGOW_10720 [Gammaproteobacteria bacterium]